MKRGYILSLVTSFLLVLLLVPACRDENPLVEDITEELPAVG